MQQIMADMRTGVDGFGGRKAEKILDYEKGIDGLPKSDVMKFLLEDRCSIVVRPSGTEPKLKVYISVGAKDQEEAEKKEQEILADLEKRLK